LVQQATASHGCDAKAATQVDVLRAARSFALSLARIETSPGRRFSIDDTVVGARRIDLEDAQVGPAVAIEHAVDGGRLLVDLDHVERAGAVEDLKRGRLSVSRVGAMRTGNTSTCPRPAWAWHPGRACASEHCWTSQQWHPGEKAGAKGGRPGPLHRLRPVAFLYPIAAAHARRGKRQRTP